MSTSNLLGPAAPDFDDPLGLLRACHERILKHIEMLQALAAHVEATGVDGEARSAAAAVHRYFSTAGRHHHQDEEQEVFPRLSRQSLKLADLVYGLRKDHELMDELWQELEPLLVRPASITDTAAFSRLAARFAEAYRHHVEKENVELLELARHILSSDELKKIGNAMAERRGLRPKY